MSVDQPDQGTMALWAADCAERVLPIFEAQHPGDDRPRKAIEAARAWDRGQISVSEAREAAFAAHAAAGNSRRELRVPWRIGIDFRFSCWI